MATTTTQGDRDDDFSHTVDGELVFDAGQCDRVAQDDSWDCECSLSFAGVASGELTTTAVVVDLPMDIKQFMRAFRDGLARTNICRECAAVYAHRARICALQWPIGTIIERDRDVIQERLPVG